MTISSIVHQNRLDQYTQNKIEKNGDAPQDRPSAAHGSEQDKVNLSEQAKGLMQTQNAVKSSADVRSDKVAELKAKVSSGEYQPDSRTIAENMVQMEKDIFNGLV